MSGIADEWAIGDRVFSRGQQYRMMGTRPHVCRDGTKTKLLVFSTNCAECGVEFDFTVTAASASKGWFSRRCQEHKRPGVRAIRSKRVGQEG